MTQGEKRLRRIVITDSSDIGSLTYDRDKELLLVEFTTGQTYVYENVSLMDFANLITSDSIGQWFHRYIRKHPSFYPFTRKES